MTSTMIERVAIQLWQQHNASSGIIQKRYSPIPLRWLKMARVAIVTMREPTEAMTDAASKEPGCGCPCCGQADDWRAMIDAVLAETETSAPRGFTPGPYYYGPGEKPGDRPFYSATRKEGS